MKKFALVLVGLGLAACSSSSGDDAESLTAAVKKGSYDAPPAPSPAPPTTSDDVDNKPSESSETANPTTCAEVRATAASSKVDWSWTNGGSAKDPVFIDVIAFLEHHDDDGDGKHRYFIDLDFSDVKNSSLFNSFGGVPMNEHRISFSGGIESDTELKDPWHGDFNGDNGAWVEHSTCRNGETEQDLFENQPGENRITITNADPSFVDGTFERRDADGKVIATGTFHAPYGGKSTDQPKFRTHAASGLTCCLLGD